MTINLNKLTLEERTAELRRLLLLKFEEERKIVERNKSTKK